MLEEAWLIMKIEVRAVVSAASSTKSRMDAPIQVTRGGTTYGMTPACPLCRDRGEVSHYGWRRGGWVPVVEPCPRCRPPAPVAA